MKSRNFVLAGSTASDAYAPKPAAKTGVTPAKKVQQYRFSPVPPVVKVAPVKTPAGTEPEAVAETVPATLATIEAAAVEKPKPTRKSPRKASTIPVFITFEGLSRPIACKIADMSATGARLKFTRGSAYSFDNPANLPERFTMQMPTDRTEVDCTVAWRKETELGVRFTSIHRPIRKPAKN